MTDPMKIAVSMLFIVTALLITGCKTKETPPPMVASQDAIDVAPEVMEECKPNLGTLTELEYTELGFVSMVIPKWVERYNECRNLNHAKLMLLHNVFSTPIVEIRK